MRDENPICTLRDYSKPSHEGYMNTIELPKRNNVVPLRSNTIRLAQNRCSFHRLWSEDPNQHLKDLLKHVDSLDFDVANRERTRMRLFQFSLRNQTSNWLERLPAGSILTWEDLTTHRWLQIQIFYDHVSFHLKCKIDCATDGKLRDKNANESWEIIENLALHDYEGWNDLKDFVKPFKAISTSQSTSKTPDRRLLKLEHQINFLLKGSRLTPRSSSTHIPQAYAEVSQALGTTFEAQERDYIAAHTERMERFENSSFKQREEINDRITEMFGLLKELTASMAPETCKIDCATDGKLRDKNANESWEIIENLALYDYEGWNDLKDFVKPFKAISTSQSTSKTPDRRLLELEHQINFLLKGSRLTPRSSSTHIPQAYAKVPQALGTTFEARERDYIAAHTERMERFENSIFKQREEINDRMTEMFGLLKELTASMAPETVLIREEARHPITKT
nr:MAK10-like protein [Tanacetum cinerariifolium]